MPDMATDTVQQIKDRLSIIDVVGQYVKLERAGTSMRARCPFHAERTPSFHVSPERGTYHCFGCGVGGDIFSFVEAIEGLDFKGALKVLADKAGVEVVYARGTKEGKDERERLLELLETATIYYTNQLTAEAKKYLKERGLSDDTIKTFRIGWAGDAWSDASDYLKGKKFTDKEMLDAGVAKKNERGGLTDKFRNRIMFPIADSAGRVIGFSGRTFGEKASPEAPKYLNSPETPLFHKSRILYGFDRAKMAIRKHNFAVLVEGQMDLLASHQAGWANTVAVSGTAFTEEHAALLKRMSENLVLALDADQAGIKAAGRAARAALLGGMQVKVARLPSGLDPADLIQKEGVDAWRAAIRDSKDIITFLLDVLEEYAKSPDNFRRAVETVVLPFLSDVQSPIAREQYLTQIAKRLGVSEKAVSEAFAKHSRAQTPTRAKEAAAPARPETVSDRSRHAFAILLWQESLPRAALDTASYRTRLQEALGEEAFARMEASDDTEKESMRFFAERTYGRADPLARQAESLLAIITLDRLQIELAEVSALLKAAEEKGDEAEMARLMDAHKLLTGRIANLQSSV
jgi:DNA primase